MFPRYSVSILLDIRNCQAYTMLHSQYTPVSLQFVPLMKAYFVPENFYCEGEVLTMPVPTQVALQVDISSLKEDPKYSVFIDDTNMARIQ